MSREAEYFHREWMGMAQPQGLVVSVPVLLEAQTFLRQPASVQQRFRELCPLIDPERPEAGRRMRDLEELLAEMLELTPDLFDVGDDLPEKLAYDAAEGQTVRPTRALKRRSPRAADAPAADTAAARAGRDYVMLVWELPQVLDFDEPEAVTGDWEYAPHFKFDRLLRQTQVPVGLLVHRRALRLVYAPHGESTGHVTFRIDDMAAPIGRPLLDAFLMLLKASRWFAAKPEHQLPALLAASRERQAEVTEELAGQVYEALEILLRGFEHAAARDGSRALEEAARQSDDQLYHGLLTVLLRLVFLLYAEDRDLLPVGHDLYAQHFSVLALYDDLADAAGRFPDSMDRRFGAWGRLLAVFRAVYEGVRYDGLALPERHGSLFHPETYPFLEGRVPGGGHPHTEEDRARVRIPSVDDGTVHGVLEKLLVLDGDRLSYQALDVEQIGSVYEALMGYHVIRVFSPAVRMGKSRVWVEVGELLDLPANQRARWLLDHTDASRKQSKILAKAVHAAEKEGGAEAVRAVLRENAGSRLKEAEAGRWVIQPGAERRRTSTHYTPRELAEGIVERTLEPLLSALGPEPSSETLLSLKVCDPAMGSGAFLAAACRHLGDRVVEAWEREGAAQGITEEHGDRVIHARRLVVARCLYGVDKNPHAVELAKMSLWLLTLAKDLPFTFLDHNLRHGDSLVGLTLDQLRGFHWKPDTQDDLASQALNRAIEETVSKRREILALADQDDPNARREQERLLEDSRDAARRIMLLGDLVVGAFFAETTKTKRNKELGQRLPWIHEWLEAGGPVPSELEDWRQEIRERVPVFHWMLEFPEIFLENRPDPLADGKSGGKAWMDAFVGNPPFAGKNGILDAGGKEYLSWLQTVHKGAHGNADLSAHFFRRTSLLLGDHGTLGLIATNTIAQGDTRSSALQPLVSKEGLEIYDATESMPWPGHAAVTVSVVQLAKGKTTKAVEEKRLDGETVTVINSRLRPKPERPDPKKLKANEGLSFQGTIVLGQGFVLTPEERDALIEKDPRNKERIYPYIGGAEVNRNPDQSHDRYVINFGQMTLEEAEEWPNLIEIVRREVKPQRDRDKRVARRKYWWRFAEPAVGLYRALADLDRCLVNSRHSKHLLSGSPRCLVAAIVSKHLMFSFQPTDRVFSHKLYVFPLATYSAFAALQSRAHVYWAWLLSSTMKTDLNYSASACFETFPFPDSDPSSMIPEVEVAGELFYEARASYMEATGQGLTTTHNLLIDVECTEPRIEELRRLYEDMERAILSAYGWQDLALPPYRQPTGETEKRALQEFEDELLDRLFVLNKKRSNKERGTAARRRKESRKSDESAPSVKRQSDQARLFE